MGHIGVKSLRSAVDRLLFDNCSRPSCIVCSKANIKRFPFPQKVSHRATRVLQRIHCDICGPLPSSYGSYRYFILFIDCFSHFTSLHLMKSRDSAPDLFMQFCSTAETFTKEKLCLLHVDNAPELIQGCFQAHCISHGITYEKTVPDSPNQNSVAERSNQTLACMAQAMLLDANLSSWFWPFAVQTAVHIKNRVPHSNLPPHTTPYELWYGEKPNLGYFCVFGTHCTSHLLSNSLTKFEPRGESGHFLRYATDSKGYIVWTPSANGQGGSIKIRRDIRFHYLPDIVPPNLQRTIDFNPFSAQNDNSPAPSGDRPVHHRPDHFNFENTYAFFLFISR